MYTIGYMVFGWDLQPWFQSLPDQSLFENLTEQLNTTTPTLKKIDKGVVVEEFPNPYYGLHVKETFFGPFGFDDGKIGVHTAYSGSGFCPLVFGLAIAEFDETETVRLEDGLFASVPVDLQPEAITKKLGDWLDNLELDPSTEFVDPLSEEDRTVYLQGVKDLRRHTKEEPQLLIVWGTS